MADAENRFAAAQVGRYPMVTPVRWASKKIDHRDRRFDNCFAAAQDLNTQFLRYLDPDRLLVAWRMVAQLEPYGLNGAVPYGGWMALGPHQHSDMGHFSGHYLSATAFTLAATGDPIIQVRGRPGNRASFSLLLLHSRLGMRGLACVVWADLTVTPAAPAAEVGVPGRRDRQVPGRHLRREREHPPLAIGTPRNCSQGPRSIHCCES